MFQMMQNQQGNQFNFQSPGIYSIVIKFYLSIKNQYFEYFRSYIIPFVLKRCMHKGRHMLTNTQKSFFSENYTRTHTAVSSVSKRHLFRITVILNNVVCLYCNQRNQVSRPDPLTIVIFQNRQFEPPQTTAPNHIYSNPALAFFFFFFQLIVLLDISRVSCTMFRRPMVWS